MKILVIIGEESGELHACQVLNELIKLRPEIEIFGTGGNQFKKIATCFYHINELNVLGLTDALKQYKKLKKIQTELKTHLIDENIDAVFLVDYVGFNLRFAKIAKELNKKVFFYISPQVWAWKENRVFEIKKYVDYLIVLFPFEVTFYQKKANYQVYYFGHPLSRIIERIHPQIQKQIQTDYANDKRIAIIPGSRKKEIEEHIEILLDAAHKLLEQDQNYSFFIPIADHIKSTFIYNKITKNHKKIYLITDNKYSILSQCHFAWVVSGTVSLEVALLKIPQIVVRRGSLLTYFVAHYLLKIKYFALPNIILDKLAVKELIQKQFNSIKLSEETHHVFSNIEKQRSIFNHIYQQIFEILDDENQSYKKTAIFVHQKLKAIQNLRMH